MKKLLLALLMIISITTSSSAIVVRSVMGGAVDGPLGQCVGTTMNVLQSITIPVVQRSYDLELVGNTAYALTGASSNGRVSKITLNPLTFISTLVSVVSVSTSNREPRLYVNSDQSFLVANDGTSSLRPIRLSTFVNETLLTISNTSSIDSTAIDGNTLHVLKNDTAAGFRKVRPIDISTFPFVDPGIGSDVTVEDASRFYAAFTRELPLFMARNTAFVAPNIVNNLSTTAVITPNVRISSIATSGNNIFIGGTNGEISRVINSPLAEAESLIVGSSFDEVSELLIIGSNLYATDRTGRIAKINASAFTVTSVVDAGFGRIEGIQFDGTNGTIWLVADEANVVTLFEICP